MGDKKEPPEVNYVHQTAIHVETINKENFHQKLYTNYSVNPNKKLSVLPGKPNSEQDEGEEEDAHFLKVIKRANLEPTKKYSQPQTEAQEIGWITRPILDTDRGDRRLNFYRSSCEITKYMDAFWRLKEAENLT